MCVSQLDIGFSDFSDVLYVELCEQSGANSTHADENRKIRQKTALTD